MLEGGKGGIVFKWINKQEIMNNHLGKGKGNSLQAYVNKLHVEYIGTRPGTVYNENINHGLFGNVYSQNGELLDLENFELKDINEKMKDITKKNIDVFKTVFSMTEDDVLRYGMNKDTWKDILTKRITDIAKASNIPPESIEWTASFHSKKQNPHCHLVFWNKDQNLELNKKPFLKFKEIRKCIAKEVYKEELEKLYDTKNISKKEIKDMSKEELANYKNEIKKKLNNPDLKFNEVDISKEEKLLKLYTDNLKVGDRVYFYSKQEPKNFVEIKKEAVTTNRKYFGNEITENQEVLKFRNNGDRSLLYKSDDFTDTACFLTDFKDIGIAKTKEELEKIIEERQEEEFKIDNELREIMPSIVPNNILSHEFRTKSFDEITNRIASLKELIKAENKKARGEEKLTFRYDLQQPKVKKEIDKISTLILNTSKDCKLQFNQYISSSLDIARYSQDIDNKNDYERVKARAKDEAFNKIGNQILQALKTSINEDYKAKYEEKKREYEARGLEYKIKQADFEKQIKDRETRELIESVFKTLDTENISNRAKQNRLKMDFGNMTKRQIREYMKMKENSSGFEWFD